MNILENEWNNLKLLPVHYKKMIDNYFSDPTGKFKIENDLLYVDIDSWGIEKFFIKKLNNNEIKQHFYTPHFNIFQKIYNIALCIQIGNWEIFKKMEYYIKNFNNIHINIYFVMIREVALHENIMYLYTNYKNSVILSAENRGMDIGLFMINLYYILEQKYNHDYIIKVHTKTSDEFRNNALTSLIGSHDKIIRNIKLLVKDEIGMISGHNILKYKENKELFHSNIYHLKNLVKYLYDTDIDKDYLEFCGGTMFIFKYKIVSTLNLNHIEYFYKSLNNIDTLDFNWYSVFYKMNINNKDDIVRDYIKNKNTKYPNNISYQNKTGKGGLRDCMIEHAFERLFGYICKKNDLSIVNPS
jgi:hypothetical protein